ncbi:MAG: hypothetical protein CMO97_02175 [Woeseia sp.]|nr:hypothetical protein [Woeseia sp.]|tara:strand:- start:1174 stop:1413 length:240 start_codon:yes stop_codon:yes gene_type:complete
MVQVQEIKLGDIVRHRDWAEGDPDPGDVNEESHAWGTTGLVIALLKTTEFKDEMTPAAEYIDENGDIYLAALYDLEIVQ